MVTFGQCWHYHNVAAVGGYDVIGVIDTTLNTHWFTIRASYAPRSHSLASPETYRVMKIVGVIAWRNTLRHHHEYTAALMIPYGEPSYVWHTVIINGGGGIADTIIGERRWR